MERLDHQTANAWEVDRGAELPTLTDLCTFLDRRARGLAHAQPNTSQRNNAESNKRKNGENSGYRPQHGVTVKKEPTESTDKERPACKHCQGNHAIYHCPKIRAMGLAKRKEAVRATKLCFNCLRDHAPGKCQFGACTKCPDERHNSMLCPKRVASANSVVATETAEPKAKRRKLAKKKADTTD